mgnify:CR=1 FL=1
MNVLQIGAGGGKSVIAIHQALNKNCPLIVRNEDAKIKIQRLFDKLVNCNGCNIMEANRDKLEVWTYKEFTFAVHEGRYHYDSVVIDDLDLILKDRWKINPLNINFTTC